VITLAVDFGIMFQEFIPTNLRE